MPDGEARSGGIVAHVAQGTGGMPGQDDSGAEEPRIKEAAENPAGKDRQGPDGVAGKPDPERVRHFHLAEAAGQGAITLRQPHRHHRRASPRLIVCTNP